MPNYFAHLIFGAKVLRETPEELSDPIRREREAFNLGCLGPDPLYFYRPALVTACRREAMRLHGESALPVFQRLAGAIRDGVPQSGSYAAGFLCHFALDAACHGFIRSQAEAGRIAHLAMEAELDRRLIENRGLVSAGRVYLPPIEDEHVYTAAAAAYETAAPAQLRRGYEAMRYYSRLLAQRYGTRGGWLADKAIGLIPACRELRGVILRREPAPESRECGDRILELFHSEVPAAAAHLREFMASVSNGAALSPWFDRDFNGRSGANCGQGRS